MLKASPRAGILSAVAVLLALVAVPATAGGASAAPTPPQHGAFAGPSGNLRMFAYGNSHFAAAAAKLPSGLVRALKRDLGISAEQYLNDADATARSADVVSSLSTHGVHVLGSSISGTHLSVNVASRADVAAVEAAGATAVIGAPAPAPKITDAVATTGTAIYGGQAYLWNQPAGAQVEVHQCSIGFNGYGISGGSISADRAVSAGHCMTGATTSTPMYPIPDNVAGLPGSVDQAWYDAEEATFGHPYDWQFGGNYDSALLTINSGNTQTPTVATWGGGTGAPNSTTPITVTGDVVAVVGANLCKSGSRTGWTCGTIKYTNLVIAVNEDGVLHKVNSVAATTCDNPGDSGGSAVVGTLAVGVTSWGSSDHTCGQDGFYSGYFPMVSSSSSHVSIESQYGSTWDLQVSLSTPVVTSPASSPAILTDGDTISGTLANATSRIGVALYVDGSTTSAAHTTATDGKWSFPVSALGAAGTAHTFKVGAYFRSVQLALTGTKTVTIEPKTSVSKPKISGSAKVGSTLTAKATPKPSDSTVSYQWKAGSTIVGTNSSSYVPTAADYGHKITVTATATHSDYKTGSGVVSSSTSSVTHGSLSAHTPIVGGSRHVGQELTSSFSTAWGPAGVSLSYQWLRSGKSITGATSSAYTLQDADHDHTVTLKVTGRLDGYTTASKTSSSSTKTAWRLFDTATAPTIAGTVTVGQTLTVTVPDWTPTPTGTTIQWKVSGKSVSHATHSTFVVPTSAADKIITVTVTRSLSHYSTTSVTSAATAPATPLDFAVAPVPTITGTFAKGKKLTAHTGTWSPTPSFSYRWYRDGVSISSATHSTHTVTSSDLGHEVTVVVTGTKTGYAKTARTSAQAI